MEKNEVILRPRFSKETNHSSEEVIALFEAVKKERKDYHISRVDHHIYLKIPKEDQHYWSPQLHLEIDEVDEESSSIRGLFGPNPAIWTMFMFFHFFVGASFLAFGVWAYSNYSLDKPFLMQMIMLFVMILVWFVLYFVGRMGKQTGHDQMHELYAFMNYVLHKE